MAGNGPQPASPKREPPQPPAEAPRQHKIFNQYEQVVIARDINIGRSREEEFETLERDSLLDQPVPRLARKYAKQVREHTLLVFGGTYEEKPDVARQVALILVSEPPENEGGGTPPVERRLRERSHTSDPNGLLRAISNEKKPAVLLLHDVHPQDLAYNAGRLREEAAKGEHLILITTERSRDSWDVALQGLRDCWEDLHPERLYLALDMVGELLKHIKPALGRLPEGVFKEEFEPMGSRLGGVELIEIASRLQTPRRVDAFVEQLCSLAKERDVDQTVINELIEEVTSLERRITRWFDTQLRADEKVLAIGLNFFQGLADDQCFSALEQWVAHIRAHRDPTQRTFDYVDVENLKHYFKSSEDSSETRFKVLSTAHWRCIFKVAWQHHRRKIVSSLPVLTHMAARSDDWELNDSPQQLGELRGVVRDTLAEIGTLSLSGVQRPLLYLASSQDPWVQVIAADAMARWRVLGKEEQFFDTMERWRTDARPREIVKTFMGSQDTADHAGPLEFLHATLALTVSMAAIYDPPNALHTKLVELLKHVAHERHAFVRLRFIHTIRSVTALHLEQCRDQGLLRYLLRQHPELALMIGSSLAHAYALGYRDNRDQVMTTLEELHAESGRPRSDSPTRITLLCTLAYVYGSMEYTSGGPLTASVGFARLQEMLKRESDPEVRRTVVEAVAFQALRDFKQVASLLQKLMAEIERDESDEIVKLLEAIYLLQRQDLRGGDVWMLWKGREYMVWLDSARPLTSIEEIMLAWIQDPDFPAAQQIALRASIAFTESLDEEEARFIVRQTQRRERETKRNAVPQGTKQPAAASFESPSWYTRVFVPTWVTLFTGGQHRAQHKRIIAGLLATSLAQNAKEPGALAFVLEKWKEQGDPDTGAIVEKLRSAMAWHPYAGWLPVAGGVVVLLLGVLSLLR